MELSYEKLWKLLKINKMRKGDFARAAKISQYTMSKLNNNKPVDLSIVMNICKVFHCDIGDVVEMIEN